MTDNQHIYRERRSGFTLLEVIVVLVIVAILGSAMLAYFGNSALARIHLPQTNLDMALALQRDFENVTNAYRNGSAMVPEAGHVLESTPPFYYQVSGNTAVACSPGTDPADCTGTGPILYKVKMLNTNPAHLGEQITVYMTLP